MKKLREKNEPAAREAGRTRRKWSRDLVREELAALHEKGCRMSVREIPGIDGTLVRAAYHYYGGWVKALEAAGIRPSYIPPLAILDGEMVLEAIRERYAEGKRLDHKAVREEDKGLRNAGVWRFGSWKRAIEAAGIDYGEICLFPPWTEERVLKGIVELQSSGADLLSTKVSKEHNPLYRWGVHFFGGWKKAVLAAGITNYDDYRKPGKWDEEEVVKRIKERIKQGKPINARAVQRDESGLYGAARRVFGTWEKASRGNKHRKSPGGAKRLS